MIGHIAKYFVVLVACLMLHATARAETLVLPDNLVDLRSKQGEQLLLESNAIDPYVALSSNFLTQQNQAFCGVASIVIVLNTLEIPAPITQAYQPYRTFTQDNFFDERTESILPREVLMKQGMTLDELGRLLAIHLVEVGVHHAVDGSLDEFRSAAREHLGKDRAVIVNYLRRAIGEERGGHISPLAAYDAQTDRFLILDVARYKYPPVWVKTAELFAAMNTIDTENQNKTRGYVLVRKLPSNPAASAN